MGTTIAIQQAEKKIYTVEEYFELEKHAEDRHEFVNGKLYKMPGESVNANLIADNCGFAMRTALKSQGYVVIRHDVRTNVKQRKIYRYPDVALAKRSEITDTHAVNKPVLLIEVSSIGSAKTDNDDKVNEYTALNSVQYYLVISQYEPLVKVYCRTEQGWVFKIFDNITDAIDFPNLNFSMKLTDIYEDVNFADHQSDSDTPQ